jgi:hypothetical protein
MSRQEVPHTKGAPMRVRTRRWLRGAGALGLMLVACMTSAAVAAAGPEFRPGASGLGDPYCSAAVGDPEAPSSPGQASAHSPIAPDGQA